MKRRPAVRVDTVTFDEVAIGCVIFLPPSYLGCLPRSLSVKSKGRPYYSDESNNGIPGPTRQCSPDQPARPQTFTAGLRAVGPSGLARRAMAKLRLGKHSVSQLR